MLLMSQRWKVFYMPFPYTTCKTYFYSSCTQNWFSTQLWEMPRYILHIKLTEAASGVSVTGWTNGSEIENCQTDKGLKKRGEGSTCLYSPSDHSCIIPHHNINLLQQAIHFTLLLLVWCSNNPDTTVSRLQPRDRKGQISCISFCTATRCKA